MALYQFSKNILQEVVYFKTGFPFFTLNWRSHKGEWRDLPYLWSFSAWDSWRTPWPYVTLEDRGVTDLREGTTCHLRRPSTPSLPSYLLGYRIVLSRLTSASFFSFVAFQPGDTGLAVATKILRSKKTRWLRDSWKSSIKGRFDQIWSSNWTVARDKW